jgi:hypothetical protein
MKIEIKPLNALEMLDHGPTVLLGVHDEKNSRFFIFQETDLYT